MIWLQVVWAAVLLTALCYAFGYGAFRVAGFRASFSFAGIFHRLVVGSVLMVSLYALLLTGGISVYWVLLLLLGLAYVYSRRTKDFGSIEKDASWKWLGIFLGVFALLVALAWSLLYDAEMCRMWVYKYQPEETLYYAQIAATLDLGFESRNTYQPLFDQEFGGISPYHYFQLYITLLASKLSGLSTFSALHLVIKPLLQLWLVLGLTTLVGRPRVGSLLISVTLLLCLYQLRSVWVLNAGVVGYLDSYSPAFMEKLLPLALLSTLAVHAMLRSAMPLAILALSALPVLNLVAAPAVYGGIGLYLLVHMIRTKKCPWMLWAPLISAVVLIGILVLFGAQLTVYPGHVDTELALNMGQVKEWVMNALLLLLGLLIAHFPIWLYLVQYRKKAVLRQQWLLFGAMWLCAMLAYVVLNGKSKESMQLYWVMHTVLLLPFFVYHLSATVSQKALRTAGLGVIVVLSGAMTYLKAEELYKPAPDHYRYSQAYIQGVSALVAAQPEGMRYGIGLRDSSSLYDPVTYVASWPFGCPQLYWQASGWFFEHATLHRMPQSMYAGSNLKYFGRHNHFERWKQQQPGTSDDHQAGFVRAHKIRYGIAYRNAPIGPKLEALVDTMLTDKLSGERFIIFAP